MNKKFLEQLPNELREQLEKTPIQRWIRASEDLNMEKNKDVVEVESLGIRFERTARNELKKRSHPSYNWQLRRDDDSLYSLWWRIWFKESNSTIQIDLHSSFNTRKSSCYEIDLENCVTSTEFVDTLYHLRGRAWCFPELIWAVMEVANLASQKIFGKAIHRAYSDFGELNWRN